MANITITQEKNICRFYKDGNYIGCVDINTGTRYGKSGREVKKLAINSSDKIDAPSTMFFLGLKHYAEKAENPFPIEISVIESMVKIAEKSDLRIDPYRFYADLPNKSTCYYFVKHFSEFVADYKAKQGTRFYWYEFQRWSADKRFELWLRQKINYPLNLSFYERDYLQQFYEYNIVNNRYNLTEVEIDRIIGYATKQRIFASISANSLSNFCEWCKTLKIEIPKTQCFTRTYAEIQQSYKRWKDEKNSERIRASMAKHSDWWNFEYSGFTIVAPQTAQDIVNEGIKMHHCVGSYVDRVANGETFIVFVRRAETPDIPYITCQVNTNGVLGQYYLAYDNHISNSIDRDFKTAFQNHIKQCIMRGE